MSKEQRAWEAWLETKTAETVRDNRAIDPELLAQLRALADGWRTEYEDSGHDYELAGVVSCADQLEALLPQR